MRILNLVLLVVIFFSPIVSSEPLKMKYFQKDPRYSYRIALLQLALEKTKSSYGSFALEPIDETVSQNRGELYLEEGTKVNIAFLPTNKERDAKFLPIKVPILRGLLGYRIAIIRKDSLADFSTVDSLETLKSNYIAGFGSQWADMQILQINGIPVVGSVKYESLFDMLASGRFDYFPRGLNEAWDEVEQRKGSHPNLVVDQHMAMYYPYPVYFFVNKKDSVLADRIGRGLQAAIEDGSFKDLFLRYHQKIIAKAGLDRRKLFILRNPTLTDETPELDTSWWLDQKRLTSGAKTSPIK